jgi:hypothetical protein
MRSCPTRLVKLCVLAVLTLAVSGCPPGDKPFDPPKPADPPVVTLTSPATNAALTTDSVTVEGTATGSEPITRVGYVLNGGGEQSVVIQSGTSVNFRFTAPLRAGSNTLEVHAYGASNRKGSRSLSFTADPCIPTLSAVTAAPMSEIVVRGVPARFGELRGTARIAGAAGGAVLMPVRRENGDVALVVPLHPTSPGAGGDVEVVLSDAASTCRALPLRIGALPAAPHATDAVVSGLNQVIGTIATGLGIDRAVLLGDPAALAPELRPLAIALQRLEGPGNPNSLKAVLDGTAPLLRGAPLDRELLNGVLAQSGLAETLQTFRQQLAALGPAPAGAGAATSVSDVAGPPYIATSGGTSATITAEQLHYWMQVQQLAASLVLPTQHLEVSYLALAAQMFNHLSRATSTSEFLQAYLFMNVAAAVALQHDALLGIKTGVAQLLPSQLDPLVLHVDRTTLEIGASTAWRATVSGRGQPWSVFLPAHLGAQFVNMGSLGTVLNQMMARVTLTAEQQAALVGLAGYLQSSLQSSLGSLACSEYVCWVAGEATVYGPADVTAEPHSLVAFSQPDVLRLVDGQRNRITALAATSRDAPVTMQVRTTPGRFNGRSAQGDRAITIAERPLVLTTLQINGTPVDAATVPVVVGSAVFRLRVQAGEGEICGIRFGADAEQPPTASAPDPVLRFNPCLPAGGTTEVDVNVDLAARADGVYHTAFQVIDGRGPAPGRRRPGSTCATGPRSASSRSTARR